MTFRICPISSFGIHYHCNWGQKMPHTANKTRGSAVDLLVFHDKSTGAFVEILISTDCLLRLKLDHGNRQIHDSAPNPRYFHDFCVHAISTTLISTANPPVSTANPLRDSSQESIRPDFHGKSTVDWGWFYSATATFSKLRLSLRLPLHNLFINCSARLSCTRSHRPLAPSKLRN